MVKYIRSDLEFILAQIKIAEDHSLYIATEGAEGKALFGPNGSVPAYNISWGLRTVDGSYNHLLPGQEQWGASDRPFNELMDPDFRTVMVDPPGPMGPVPMSYTPTNTDPDGPDLDGLPGGQGSGVPGDVMDPSLRIISNLIVDQTLGNPAAILTALQNAGVDDPGLVITAQISAAYAPLRPFFIDVAEAARAEASAAAAAAANPGNSALQTAAAQAAAALQAAQDALDTEAGGPTGLYAILDEHGIALDGANLHIPNAAPDEGLSAPFNSWFTLFGQFFDHGLDLVNKGDSGTVMIPLQPDDPLYVVGGSTNFMVLTRATRTAGEDGIWGNADDVKPINTTTAFVDQNQTYTSHPSHQVFLRQYVSTPGGPAATGKLIQGSQGDAGGMATWADVKFQAATVLGIKLTDFDVGKVPLLRTDPYGNYIPGDNGFPQLITGVGVDGIPNTDDDIVVEGNPANPVDPTVVNAIRTTQAFLADIAHTAVPDGAEDGDTEIGGNIPDDGTYDDELLDAHFIAGDGRANENIGLTAVHHVFHSEHNRLVDHTKETVLATGDIAFINEWLAVDIAAIPSDLNTLVWDGERLFQAAKFGTEMQYQHLVFEEFARKVQPAINTFLVPDGFDTTLDPTIFAEFAHVVYRFGHSMLTESIDRFDSNFTPDHISLIQGFLNPSAFTGPGGTIDDDIAAGAIIRGMTRQVGNEIDEFVTSALRNNLLGLPLDLATINLARGRDTGVPSLNEARRTFFEMTNQDVRLAPYASWIDYAGHLKHEASIINFVAAYGTHSLITGADTIQEKRDAALTIITGVSVGGFVVPLDADDFLSGTGDYADDLGGLENVDLWIGGLAEEIMPFGGMLGATFNFVFERQMENLQSGDRFYYLQRLDGLHLFGEMENNSFASMIMRNTNATHLPSDVFSTPGLILEVDPAKQFNDLDGDGDLEGGDPTGGGILTQVVVRNNPATSGPDANYLRYTGDEHVILGGTEGADILIASIGDDTLFGDGGNDNLEGGFGNDIINGGAGDDIIKDAGGDDNIKAGDGNDVVHSGPGLDLVLGGAGQDFIFLGTDEGSEVFGGEGNDFIYGNKNAERLLGNEGDDWLETGTFDGAPGDNFDEIFAHDGIDGHDVFLGDGGFDEFIGEGGDDIMVGSPGRGKMVGMSGWDWATYKDNTGPIDADLSRAVVFDENPTPPQNAALDTFEAVEGLSGTKHNDLLTGSDITAEERLPFAQGGSEGFRGSQLTKEGIARIAGLQAVLGLTDAQFAALAANAVAYNAGDIILGGDGSDTIMGRAGDDIIDGDKWLDVRIGVYANTPAGIGTGALIKSVASMTELSTDMFNGTYNPGQLRIIREIKTDTTTGDIDVAKFQGDRGQYAFSATADGQVIVSHAVEDSLDGTDKLRNIERVQFATGNALNVIVGTPNNDVLPGTAQDDLMLGLGGSDVLNAGAGNDVLVGGPSGTGGNYRDEFNTTSYSNQNGSLNFTGNWTETNDGGANGGAGGGDIDATGARLRFIGTIGGGESISRGINLAGASAVTVTFAYEDDDLDAGEQVVVEVGNGTTWTSLGTIGGSGPDGNNNFSAQLTAAQISSSNRIRFRAEGDWESGENLYIDNLNIALSGADILNGGIGDDTYSFAPGDGEDIINENDTNGGTADRISILSPLDVNGVAVMTGLNAFDNNTGTNNGSLVLSFNGQQVTVNGHYTGTANAQAGVERINFNGATFAGYLLGTEDYLISRADPNNRDSGGVNLSASTVNNFIAGENGVNDAIVGGLANDLIFGGTGNNDLDGGAGDDLLVGGSASDILDGGVDADTMVGLEGNDTYIVDDLLDIVVEAAGGGTADEVLTDLAAYTLGNTDIENLTYTGIDADQFVGTGNALGNAITGGDLADTLSGLAGADTLNGGLGADTMRGGADNDVYFVDDAGDVVDETSAGSTGVDRVESDISYALGAGVENLDLNNNAVGGWGNELANLINGNGAGNQIFGAGGGDTLAGNDGNDYLDGGSGDDTLNGGDDNDTINGGAGNDTIDVGGGVNTVIYNAPSFGNDVVLSFDAVGGTVTTQDRFDLRGLGITSANFASRVTIQDVVDAGTDDTRITIRDASNTIIGEIFVEEVDGLDITVADFILATAPTALGGASTGNNNLTGTANNDAINALAGNDTVNAGGGHDAIIGGLGNDTLNGQDGDDTFTWNANATGATDGRDVVDGGAEGPVGDTFVMVGNASTETYRVYTRAAFAALGNSLSGFNAATEIIVTRNGTNVASVIAELRAIEEIRINNADPAGNGTVGGDNFEIIGDFSTTSLRLNTITIDGQAGDDTIDIRSLDSAHRIVFKSNGGRDTIIGTMRPQDVIELPNGATAADYTTTTENGVTTMTNGEHSITFVAPDGMPQVGPNGTGDTETDTPADTDTDTDVDPPPAVTATPKVGTAQADVLMGTDGKDDIIAHAGDDVVVGGAEADTVLGGDGSDFVNAGDGRDIVFGGAGDDTVVGGADADLIYGDAGNDRLFGDAGDDVITGGAGNDSVIGGAGNDVFVAESGDGNDVYFGDEATGGSGVDTIDFSSIGVAMTVDLGAGGRGSASSSQSGSDTLWNVENVLTGAGNDTIVANASANKMNGGGGNDTFKFGSVAAADGDTIEGFQKGDRIDLSGIDASGAAGDQAFALVTGASLAGAGKLIVTHETRADGEYTVVQGSVDADNDPEFRINIAGTHNLTSTDFNL